MPGTSEMFPEGSRNSVLGPRIRPAVDAALPLELYSLLLRVPLRSRLLMNSLAFFQVRAFVIFGTCAMVTATLNQTAISPCAAVLAAKSLAPDWGSDILLLCFMEEKGSCAVFDCPDVIQIFV